MPKVLLVDADPEAHLGLHKELVAGGYEVAVARSGSLALTMLEWERPDLIVSYAKIQDMDGYELFTIVRRDPATRDTPFVLLAGRDRPIALAATEAGVDMTVTGDFTAAKVVARVGELLGYPAAPAEGGSALRRESVPRSEPAATAPIPAADAAAARVPAGPARATFQGSLGVMDLTEVTQAIALGGKTGQLVLSLASGEGTIVFEAGRVVHAQYADRTGESAFGALVAASQREAEAKFCFNQIERGELAGGPRTISRSVEQLLLNVAAEIDEGRPAASPGQLRGA